ncbi:putative ATPase [Saccharopolyspora erythraea NRRL 2338]|uniref:LuxR family transcriptional regulator n=2 Tax=Saccharopolyspora erythraea TaxID=1836 RepID=UPI000C006939|nr:LuxR family transcriptional regulator [Saccharopolyspora erythraea]PFG96158.1 putative ATPase [Saccharopolyspora erythraea NRRL 2338]
MPQDACTSARQNTSSVGLRTSSPVLIGRTAELGTLVTAVNTAPSVVFVEGEAGIGKTRLVNELLVAVRSESVWVTTGYCQPLRDPFPHGVVFECLGGCAKRLSASGRLSAVTGSLRPYLPELADRLPPAPEPLGDQAAERHRLFRAVRDLLAALGRVVVVVEDIQWADEGSRQLLRFVMTDPPPGLSLVVTYRREELPGRSAALGRAFRPSPGTSSAHLVLGPLEPEEVRGLAQAILGTPVSHEFAVDLHGGTAGIPFVLEETLHALRQREGGIRPDGRGAKRMLAELEVPALLREAMLERLDGLPAHARALAECAAVLNCPADVALLASMTMLAPARAGTAVSKLLTAGVLVEDEDGRYRYRHPLAQRAVYYALPGPRRQELHNRALRMLARQDPRPLLMLAEHAKRAGQHAARLRYGEEAAALAMQAGDATTAVELRLSLVAEPAVPPADVNRLVSRLCQDALTGLHQHEVTAELERLLPDTRLSEDVRGEVRLGLGLLLIRQEGALERGRVEVQLAIDDLGTRPDLALRGMAVLALPYIGITPLAENMRWLQRIERELGAVPRGLSGFAVLANSIGGRMHVGDPLAWQQLARVDPLSDDVGEQRHIARLYCNLADSCSWTGHYQQAERFIRNGLSVAARCGAPYVVGTAEATRIRLDWMAGRWAGLQERAWQLAETYQHLMPVVSELHLVLGWTDAAHGNWDGAAEHFARTGLSDPGNSIAPVMLAAFGGVVSVRLAQDDVVEACRQADRGLEVFRHKGVWAWAGELVPEAVEAYCAAGRTADAEKVTEELAVGLSSLDAPLAEVALLDCRARIAAHRGRPSAAAQEFHRAGRTYERLGVPYRALRMAELAAHHAPGGPDGMGELADRYAELGATRDAARCRHLLRSHGTTTPSRRGRRGYGNELSPREQDVARLLAGGRTNREIAEALFLSRRTVEQHVARVLRKLGAASRTELQRH